MIPSTSLIAAATALCLAAPANGVVIHSEFLNGDLSGVIGSPTPLGLTIGANSIVAQMGNNGNTGATDNRRDADYFTVTLGPGEFLQTITVDAYTFDPQNPGVSFAAYVNAPFFTGQGEENISGLSLFNAASGNILDDFTGSPNLLGPGTYSFWFQETGPTVVDYQITLNVVPEPGIYLFLSSALPLMMMRRRL